MAAKKKAIRKAPNLGGLIGGAQKALSGRALKLKNQERKALGKSPIKVSSTRNAKNGKTKRGTAKRAR
jgi:hypothetical protein